ncbi:MAG: cytochrome c3 family protein, partial [Dehalococcoidales bacterium]|nr:cytochrome c3 family protein [Dehalococcoidales bacterium]
MGDNVASEGNGSATGSRRQLAGPALAGVVSIIVLLAFGAFLWTRSPQFGVPGVGGLIPAATQGGPGGATASGAAPSASTPSAAGEVALKATGENLHLARASEAAGMSCEDCHFGPRPTAGNPALRASTRNACLGCHPQEAKERTARKTHQPFTNSECTLCHRFHRSDFPHQLVAPEGHLCQQCHTDIGEQKMEAYQHAPFAKDACGECHNPHGSNLDSLLRRDNLCSSCHEDVVKKGAAVAYQHVPFAKGNCKACHLPHASNYAALKPVDTKQLCLATCHSDRALNMDFS